MYQFLNPNHAGCPSAYCSAVHNLMHTAWVPQRRTSVLPGMRLVVLHVEFFLVVVLLYAAAGMARLCSNLLPAACL